MKQSPCFRRQCLSKKVIPKEWMYTKVIDVRIHNQHFHVDKYTISLPPNPVPVSNICPCAPVPLCPSSYIKSISP
jgi:hypothetical protein